LYEDLFDPTKREHLIKLAKVAEQETKQKFIAVGKAAKKAVQAAE
jgi:hypothetical protein